MEAEALGLCRSSPSIGKGPGRKEVLPSGGNNVTDGRGRVGMIAAPAEGLGKEPEGLEAVGSSGARLEVWWLEPSQEMKLHRAGGNNNNKKKNWQDSEVNKGQKIPRSGLLGDLSGGDGLT